jgi:hypothetical protein
MQLLNPVTDFTLDLGKLENGNVRFSNETINILIRGCDPHNTRLKIDLQDLNFDKQDMFTLAMIITGYSPVTQPVTSMAERGLFKDLTKNSKSWDRLDEAIYNKMKLNELNKKHTIQSYNTELNYILKQIGFVQNEAYRRLISQVEPDSSKYADYFLEYDSEANIGIKLHVKVREIYSPGHGIYFNENGLVDFVVDNNSDIGRLVLEIRKILLDLIRNHNNIIDFNNLKCTGVREDKSRLSGGKVKLINVQYTQRFIDDAERIFKLLNEIMSIEINRSEKHG